MFCKMGRSAFTVGSLENFSCESGFVSPVYGESSGSVVRSSPSNEHADFV